MTETTIDIPTRETIKQMTAGVWAGSLYRRACAEVWGAVRDTYEDEGLSDRVREAAAIADTLTESTPCQNGDRMLISHLRREALAVLGDPVI